MEGPWFTHTKPIKGKCIHSWTCDEEGRLVSLGGKHPVYRPNQVSEQGNRSFTPNLRGTPKPHELSSSQVSDIDESQRNSISCSSDSQMALKLELLIRDAKEAFQSVLTRNSDLERELEGVRDSTSQSYHQLSHSYSTTRAHETVVQPGAPRLQIPVSRTLREQNVFDISTPQTNSHSQRSSSRMSDSISLNGLNKRPVPVDSRKLGTFSGNGGRRRDSSY